MYVWITAIIRREEIILDVSYTRDNGMFINCSNHKSSDWSKRQLETAKEYGDVVDIAFPAVDVTSTAEELSEVADGLYEEIIKHAPDYVMCQGEFTLTFAVVSRLVRKGIKTVAACSERRVEETQLEDGTTRKTAVFEFVGFREYQE